MHCPKCGSKEKIKAGFIKKIQRYQSKALAHGIERNNGQQRHWFARFRRKTIAVTRYLEMLNLTMKLFAAIHTYKSISLPSLFC